MTAQELANLGTCGAANALGFNTENGCADLLEAAEAILLLRPSLVIPYATTIDAAYITSLQKAGDLIIIKDVTTFTENGNDDAIETLEDDTQLLTNKGKYKFMATFAKGLYYNRALASVEGHGQWSTGIIDKKGDIFLREDAVSGGYRGFTTGMIRKAKLVPASNTTSTKSGLEWQMSNNRELDSYYVRFANANLSFDPREVKAVNQVHLSLNSIPAGAGTSVAVTATLDRGRQDAFAGADFEDFSHTANGAASEPTADDSEATGAGVYVLTVPALVSTEVSTLRLYDTANNQAIVQIGTELYKSNTISWTTT